MKITKSFTLDLEVWTNFSTQVSNGNYSQTIEEFMKTYYLGEEKENKKLNEIQRKNSYLIKTISELNKKIKEMEVDKKKIEDDNTIIYKPSNSVYGVLK